MIHFVCPRNGEPTKCKVCPRTHLHRREQLAYPGQKVVCETHGVELIQK